MFESVEKEGQRKDNGKERRCIKICVNVGLLTYSWLSFRCVETVLFIVCCDSPI